MGPWLSLVNKLQGQFFKFLLARSGIYWCRNPKNTRKNTENVSIHYSSGFIITNACNGTGGIIAHTFKFKQIGIIVRENAAHFVRYCFCCGVQISCPGIIAQTLPQFQNFCFWCICQLFYCWKGFEKLQIIRQSLLNTRLLKDNFGKPHTVWIAIVAPRKVAFVFCVPRNEISGKKMGGFGHLAKINHIPFNFKGLCLELLILKFLYLPSRKKL